MCFLHHLYAPHKKRGMMGSVEKAHCELMYLLPVMEVFTQKNPLFITIIFRLWFKVSLYRFVTSTIAVKDHRQTIILISNSLYAVWGDLWGSAGRMTSSWHAVSDDAGFRLLSWHLLNTSTSHPRLCPASCCAHYLMLPKCVQQSGQEGRRKDHEKV